MEHLVTPGSQNAGKLNQIQMRRVMSNLEKCGRKEICYLSNNDLWTSEYMKRM